MPTGETRLVAFAPNAKFGTDLSPTVRMAKAEFGVEVFLVWHTIQGYWGGVDGRRLPGYHVCEQRRSFGEGVLHHAPCFNHDWWGNLLGFIPADHVARFYDAYHRALAQAGVDGVKVDSQAVLEALAFDQGGRIGLTRAYRRALEASVATHFGGRLINCMSNAQETFYASEQSTLLRTSIDFFPERPETHGAHLYTNAQVALWFGEFMHPDWDMFQSGPRWGAFHAARRALSGGPVYVSDRPGEHDFGVLRRLVCTDGSVLRCDLLGRPTLDTLCVDPTREPVLLKIWNRNGKSGIVGVFHAASEPSEQAPNLSGTVGPGDVPGLGGCGFAAYAHGARSLGVFRAGDRRPITLGPREFEIFTFVPIERGFAAIGLADKYNSAGALRRVESRDAGTCEIVIRDAGEFFAYSEACPRRVDQAGVTIEFEYAAPTCALRIPVRPELANRIALHW